MTTEQINAARPKQPCGQNCPDRKAGCGAVCEKWKQYEADRAEWYKVKLADTERMKNTERSKRKSDKVPTLKKRYPGRL